jgi:hypothetical protein
MYAIVLSCQKYKNKYTYKGLQKYGIAQVMRDKFSKAIAAVVRKTNLDYKNQCFECKN